MRTENQKPFMGLFMREIFGKPCSFSDLASLITNGSSIHSLHSYISFHLKVSDSSTSSPQDLSLNLKREYIAYLQFVSLWSEKHSFKFLINLLLGCISTKFPSHVTSDTLYLWYNCSVHTVGKPLTEIHITHKFSMNSYKN